MKIRIVKVPAGRAPEEFRACWVGIELLVIPDSQNPNPVGIGGGVPENLGETWTVDGEAAVAAIEERSREAAGWFRKNMAYPANPLLFRKSDCKVIEERK